MASVNNRVQLRGVDELIKILNPGPVQDAVKVVVQEHGAQLQGRAHRTAPKDTGELRRSIRLEFKESGLTAQVSATVPYAKYVEFGTRKMAARPFMKNALQHQGVKFVRDIGRVLDALG